MSQSGIYSDNEFSFDHLSPSEFEEFCFEFLQNIGFINVNWRKGTGHSSSPSDQGRDIECGRVIEDIDGDTTIEKWIIECKHYKSGVSPDKIQGILTWANSIRPDKVLIIVSNFLSNPCKNYIEEYIQNNKPPFKIKYWEKKDLEKTTQGQSLLLKKYNIGHNFPFISIIHPNHLLYIKEHRFNTLDHFFQIMDEVDEKKRDTILDFPYLFIINPKRRKAITGKEKYGDLYIDKMSYENFKSKCYEIEQYYPNILVANYVTDIILKIFLDYGDFTSIDEKIKKIEDIRSFAIDLQKEENFCNDEIFESGLKLTAKQIGRIPEQTKEHYSLYTFFCENILAKLLQEKIMYEIDRGKL